MSAQYGKCNFDGKPVDPEDVNEVRPVLAPYGPDGEGFICKDNIALLYRAFQTTKESRREVQPHIAPSGAVLMWDGRLDNREELICQLGRGITSESPDVEIVAAVYEVSGARSLATLIGDWSLSIWDSAARTLILAKDFVGTRHLYYSIENDQVTWCSILDPLVIFPRHPFKLDEEYVAGWLSFFPATHLTPYLGIHSVPPSSFVRLTRAKHEISKYWDFDPAKRIRYRTDREYEEQFRVVFSHSVRRRLRCDSPVLAELSGGMDSSSIVCVADQIRLREPSLSEVQTVSYYDDREPNWNERPYFTAIENKRGRNGCHIDVGSYSLPLPSVIDCFAAAPALYGGNNEPVSKLFQHIISGGYRVLLSGIGGDESTGGVPTPTPELADLLVTMHLKVFVQKLKSWSLAKRKPWIHLLFDAIREFLPNALIVPPTHLRPVPWLARDFVYRNKAALTGYRSRTRFFRGLPSFQENLSTLDGLRRQLGCDLPSVDCPLEKRYPYLDRDLLEFAYAIPREQFVRPGQRRSLMRRSLASIVPNEILNRRRKAYVARAQIAAIGAGWSELMSAITNMQWGSRGIVDRDAVSEALGEGRHGRDVQMVPLIRTLLLEFWLRSVTAQGYITGVEDRDTRPRSSHSASSTPTALQSSAS
jgi:asparagine synthase (glutamine-hydrolysing)